jgi:azurin
MFKTAPPAIAPAAAASGAARPGNTTIAITLSVVTGEMKFSRTTLTARPGQHVELTFSNTDDLQHNLVIFKRGTIAAYEKDLYGSMNDANAQARGFVPDSPNVLIASRLLNARESTVLSFDAPAEPGDYPFVCSFPGHWLMMRGILRVE